MKFLLLWLKGCAMGTADVVPGVSGGTIAFVSGIYEELIESIKRVDMWWITAATPGATPETWWFVMLSGAIAICAMILPGISGAFILLLLGKYQFILQAVSELNVPVLLCFLAGAVAGIVSFSHLLSWLLKHWHDVTVATLMGFMIGSLNKVWPWKEVL